MTTNHQPPAAGEAAHTWPLLPLTVDGHESADADSPLAGDGQFAPFYVFDQNEQRNIAGPFDTREQAERIARACNSHARLAAENKALREALKDVLSLAVGVFPEGERTSCVERTISNAFTILAGTNTEN